MKFNIHWFRRDLRLEDNTALTMALGSDLPVMPVFIFDTNITEDLAVDDPRITFIYSALSGMNSELEKSGAGINIFSGNPEEIWEVIIADYDVNAVFVNGDYEPYAIERDEKIKNLLGKKNIEFKTFKDQVIFEKNEIVKPDGKPYTIFTPYRNNWLKKLKDEFHFLTNISKNKGNYFLLKKKFPSLESLGFTKSKMKVRAYDLSVIREYDKHRDIPAADATSHLSPYLRFGTVSIRMIVTKAFNENHAFLNELIWREFFMQILFHFPRVVSENFRSKYENIRWLNNEKDYERWCNGETGYPIVDAGMRQMNETGFMHNRVRMITAGFLCKHLLTDWRLGEAYFARKLLDYELSSNNGNWQWAAGTGCDAAPYFRIFNPAAQQKKFDPDKEYIRKWVRDLDKTSYPEPMIDHDFARNRAIVTYKAGLR